MVELMHEVTGEPRADMRALLARAEEKAKRVARCDLHELRRVQTKTGPGWQCHKCEWTPTAEQLRSYEQGLAHGRKHSTGGGRAA